MAENSCSSRIVEYDSEEQAPLLKGGKRLSSDSEIIEVIERKSGVFDTMMNLIKIGLGTGVLSLPYSASVAGIVGAAICLIICGIWNYAAIHVMIKSQKVCGGHVGYSGLARQAFGKYGLWAVDFALFITLMGAGVAYFVFIETTMVHVTDKVPQWCWVVMCIPLCVLMSLVNNLSAMAWVSAIGIVALIAGLISVWTYGASQTTFSIPSEYYFRPQGMAQAFGISAFTYGHPIVFFPCYEQMRDADRLFLPTLAVSLIILVVMYITMGVLSVGFFWKAGVQQNIIANLASDSVFAGVVQTALAIVTLLSYPLTMFVINRLVAGYVYKFIPNERLTGIVDYTTRITLVVVAGLLAIAVPFLADVVSLLGAFTLTSMCFIFPFAFMLGIMGHRLRVSRKGALWFTILLGTCAMVFCTYNAVLKMADGGKSASPSGAAASNSLSLY